MNRNEVRDDESKSGNNKFNGKLRGEDLGEE